MSEITDHLNKRNQNKRRVGKKGVPHTLWTSTWVARWISVYLLAVRRLTSPLSPQGCFLPMAKSSTATKCGIRTGRSMLLPNHGCSETHQKSAEILHLGGVRVHWWPRTGQRGEPNAAGSHGRCYSASQELRFGSVCHCNRHKNHHLRRITVTSVMLLLHVL